MGVASSHNGNAIFGAAVRVDENVTGPSIDGLVVPSALDNFLDAFDVEREVGISSTESCVTSSRVTDELVQLLQKN